MQREAVLIVNTRSRRGYVWFEQAKKELTRQGVRLTESFALRDPALLPQITSRAVKQNTPLVIVGGGDGTLSAVARYFVGSQSALGVLPMGTGNQFARDLAIPSTIKEACQVIAQGEEQAVDLGRVSDDFFLNVTTIGLTARIARSLTVEAKRAWGRMVYVVAVWRALQHTRPFTLRLTTPQQQETLETILLVTGNGRYHAGSFLLSPQASITDGMLDIYALQTTDLHHLFQFALYLLSGKHGELPFVSSLRTESAFIEADPEQQVVVDGELQFRTPVRLSLYPNALRVLAPAALREGRG